LANARLAGTRNNLYTVVYSERREKPKYRLASVISPKSAMRSPPALCSGLIVFLLISYVALGAQTPEVSQKKAGDTYEAATRLLHEGRYSAALEQFQLEERYAPGLPQGATGEGIALALLGRLTEAQEALNRALEIDPSDWLPRRERGIVEWQLGQKDQAARDLQQVATLFPSDEPVHSVLAQYELEKKDYSKAARYFAAAPGELARHPALKLMAAEALLKSGRLDEAKVQLAALHDQSSLTPDERFRLGWLLGQAQEYQEAIQVFDSMPVDYREKLKVSYGIALAYFEEGNYPQCISILKRYTSPGAKDAAALSLLGVAEEKNGQTEDAYHSFAQGIELFPTDDESYLDIATLSAVHLNYDLPLPLVSRGIQKIPGDYKLFLTRGLLRDLKGQHAMALADYQRALALAPEQASIYVARAICYEDENRYGEAVATLENAVQRKVQDVLVYYFLADALFREGVAPNSPRFEQAQSAVAAGLSLDPSYAFMYMERAKLESMAGSTQDAILDLEHARRLEPEAPSILYQLAMAYRQAGQPTEANRLLVSVVAGNKKERENERVRTLEGIMAGVSSKNRTEP
jgi:tetratricopeptide (TPR) repeat protein